MLIFMKSLPTDYKMPLFCARKLYKTLQRNVVPVKKPASVNEIKPRRQKKHRHREEHTTYTQVRGASYFRAPDSVNESFYLHHSTPLFQHLFPQVDLSTYEKPKTALSSRIPTEPARARLSSSKSNRATSPSLPSSPPQFPPLVEACDDGTQPVGEAGDWEPLGHHQDLSTEDCADNEDGNLLPGEIHDPHGVQYCASESLASACAKKSFEDASGTDIHSRQPTRPSLVATTIADIDIPTTDVSQGSSLDSQSDNTFSQQRCSTQDTIDTQHTSKQSQTSKNTGDNTLSAAESSETMIKAPRRSSRPTKTPATVTASSTSSVLGKRLRTSKDAEEGPHKRSKS
ncbi:hypothetical protein ACN47E_005779 [Coniothyrium glycines]